MPSYSIDITPYYSLLNAPGTGFLDLQNGNVEGVITPPDQTRDMGVEVDGKFYLGHGFALRTTFTWQTAKEISNWVYTQPNGPAPDDAPFTGAVLENLDPGLKAELIPNIEATITPSYRIGRFLAQLQWQYMGARPANNDNAFDLPAYEQANLTLQWRFTNRIRLSFTENNVFNNKGTVEWAPPGDYGSFESPEAFTKAKLEADPNAVFEILQIPARAYFLKLTYDF
jgi:outer membrane receptor protein involved in Fe transport